MIRRPYLVVNAFFLEISECDISNDQAVECLHVGVPHDLMALFWQGHLKQGTPKTWKSMLTLQCMRCSWTIFHRPPYLLACRRIDSIKIYTQLAQTSKAEELKLRLKMSVRIRKLMTGKRLYLLGTMLADLGFSRLRSFTRSLQWIKTQWVDA